MILDIVILIFVSLIFIMMDISVIALAFHIYFHQGGDK